MKIRLSLLLSALMLLCSCAAAEGYVNIADLYEQAQALGRWTQTYEAHGRTIEIDLPIIVPNVDVCPLMTIRGEDPQLMGALAALTPYSVRDPDDERLYAYTVTGDEKGAEGHEGDVITFYDAKEVYYRQYMNVNKAADKSVSGTMYEVIPFFGWAMDPQTAYAEGNPMTYGEALALVGRLADLLCNSEETGLYVREVSVSGRQRHYKSQGGGHIPVGEPLEGALPGRYTFSCNQTLYGIPIALYVEKGSGSALLQVRGEDERYLHADVSIKVLSEDSFGLGFTTSIVPDDVHHADLPLRPLGDVIHVIEDEIAAGHVRSVDALELCYALCRGEEGSSWVYPVWIMHGVYVENPKAEPSGEDDQPREYGAYPIFAQTAEFGSPTVISRVYRCVKDEGQFFVLPDVLTWNDVD